MKKEEIISTVKINESKGIWKIPLDLSRKNSLMIPTHAILERWWEEKSRLQGLRHDWGIINTSCDWKIINTSKACGEILGRDIWCQTRFLSFRVRNTSYVYRLGGKNPIGEKIGWKKGKRKDLRKLKRLQLKSSLAWKRKRPITSKKQSPPQTG